MTRHLKPAITPNDLDDIDYCLFSLRADRDMLRRLGAVKAAQAVARAIKSTEGARRHMERRVRLLEMILEHPPKTEHESITETAQHPVQKT